MILLGPEAGSGKIGCLPDNSACTRTSSPCYILTVCVHKGSDKSSPARDYSIYLFCGPRAGRGRRIPDKGKISTRTNLVVVSRCYICSRYRIVNKIPDSPAGSEQY